VNATHSPPATRSDAAPRQTLVVFCILFTLCAIPIVIVKVPPLLDYPSHLARIYIITHPEDALLAQYYSVAWKVIPALALDLIVPVFTHFLDIFWAGKLFVLLTILLITSGTFALNYVLYRAWTGAALSFLFVFNGIFWDGLLPYIFSIGVALWATAGWIALRDRSWPLRALFSVAAVIALFLSHLAGVGLYLLAIFCYEVSRQRWRQWSWRRAGLDAAVMIGPFFVTLPLLLLSPTSHSLTNIDLPRLSSKWVGPYLAIRSANLVLDALFVGFLVVFLVSLIYLRRVRMPRVATLFLVLSGVTYLLLPGAFFEGSEIDIRLPTAFVFFLIGFVNWRIGGPAAALVFSGIVAAVLAVRVAGVAQAWQAYSAIVSDYEASFAHIGLGSRVLVVADLNSSWRGSGNRVTIGMDRDAIGHLASLAAIERSSLVSEVFAEPGNKIYTHLSVRAPYRSAIPSGEVPVERLMSVLPNASGPPADDPSPQDEQLRDWPRNYDYVYVKYANPGTQLQLPDVTLLYQGSSFQLYKIQHPGQ
jgi:hypothetical protein